MGIGSADPIDVVVLADSLEIPLCRLTDVAELDREVVRHFTVVDPGAFSAVTLFEGRSRLIVFNDAHAPTRRKSDVAHELAHALLQHPPSAALNEIGCRIWPADYEDEANWLAGALLVSEEAALSIAKRRLSVAEAAREYGVSQRMMQFRLNVTGAARRTGTGPKRRGGRAS